MRGRPLRLLRHAEIDVSLPLPVNTSATPAVRAQPRVFGLVALETHARIQNTFEHLPAKQTSKAPKNALTQPNELPTSFLLEPTAVRTVP